MRVRLLHHTQYAFSQEVWLDIHRVRLLPLQKDAERIENFNISFLPKTCKSYKYSDLYGNPLFKLTFPEQTDHFEILVELELELKETNPLDFLLETEALHIPLVYNGTLSKALEPFLLTDHKTWLRKVIKEEVGLIDSNTLPFLSSLNNWISKAFKYVKREEEGVYEPNEFYEKGGGSCRDFAWFHVHCLRSVGVASRFVSGYLVDINYENAEKDQLELHAWVEAYLPGAGWVAYDSTVGMMPTAKYIALAGQAHYDDAAPVHGKVGPCEIEMSYTTRIQRLN